MIGLLLLMLAAEEGRTYHPISITELAAENPAVWKRAHTHVEVEGFVTYFKREADGDMHVRLCDSAKVAGMNRQRCLVAEAIPALPLLGSGGPLLIRRGQHLRVRGIYRFDAERNHNWAEIHPIEEAEVIP